MWGRLKRLLKAMADEVKPQVDWDRLDGTEPDWPGKKPETHTCPGCGEPRPATSFELVDHFIGERYAPIVRCEECRAPKKAKSDKPFDDREIAAAK